MEVGAYVKASKAFLALHNYTYLSIFVALASAITVFIISTSYSQIIELFPGGGGGYIVATHLLSPSAGVVSGCALVVDYVLTIAVSVASGSVPASSRTRMVPERAAPKSTGTDMMFSPGGSSTLTRFETG